MTEIDSLLQDPLNSKYLVNPYFRISKATPEQIKKYFLLTHRIPRPLHLIWHLILIPKNILQFSFHLVFSIILFQQSSRFKRTIEDSMVLFLSHGIKRNLHDTNTDTFFDLLPQNLSLKKQVKITMLYTNQKWFVSKNDNTLLSKKNSNFTHILLPKFLPPGRNFKYIIRVYSFALRTLYLGFRVYFSKPTQSRILISSFSSFFNRATYTNYLLLDSVTWSTSIENLKALFLTFEGHSYEQLLIDEAHRINGNIQIFLRQHSPIVPSHYGIKFYLSRGVSKVTIITTGFFYEQYFRAISKMPEYISIGSTKIPNHGFYEKGIEPQTKKIIYAPEGSYHTSYEFIKLIKNVISDSQDFMHILRLHPDLKSNLLLRYKLFVLKHHKNFMVSGSNLHSDLTGANFLFYRSSSVGIESLNYDLVPVFYANSNLRGLNVLNSNFQTYYSVVDCVGALKCIKRSHVRLPITSKIQILDSYFSPIDYSKLHIII